MKHSTRHTEGYLLHINLWNGYVYAHLHTNGAGRIDYIIS